MEYELKPIHDSRKSFYGKAKVETTSDERNLISYNTRVATISLEPKKATVFGTISHTTLRHIKEFLKQNGFKADSKSQILQDYAPRVRL